MSNENITQVSGGFRNYVAPKGFSRVEMHDMYTPNEYMNMRYVDTISAIHAENDPTGEKKASDHMHGKYMPDFARTTIGNMGAVNAELESVLAARNKRKASTFSPMANPMQFGS